MQNDERHQNEAESRVGRDPRPACGRTVSSERLCLVCGRSLTDHRPQARFCSDACRARGRRQTKTGQRLALLDTIGAAVERLRQELTANN
jgi:predicted nucleic acid-binding Zn ribbon protein